MQTIRANWYDYPHLYDIAFGWDPSVEAEFLEACFERYAGRTVQHVFEPFCGTGRIALALAQRGYRVCGLDNNPAMIEFARRRGEAVDFELGDVCAWSPSGPVDAVVALIDSFRHLKSAESAAAAVRAFHAGLRPDGLLVLGLDVGEKPAEMTDEEQWVMERDGTVVETAVFDLRQPGETPGTSVTRVVLHVSEPDGREYEILTDDEMRTYTLASLTDLLREQGPFRIEGVLDRRYELSSPVTARDPAGDVVVVCRKGGD